ncbi:altered inheritance of mitochondria protein 19, mitochondrial [[Candida] jaroonii]|uniref:Altered inheritance of mitochondria protein 19, mitochondrial n=1 Tax=[Candida] jaroonii TaxID=467808 RepID=A0ACA9Y9V7_9ASCO|nr:altered inheritance of mitochondria protein 19, mitochondrial [[Candida] jaroonii]
MNYLDQVDEIANTPFPPWLFSSLLLYRGLTTTKPIDIVGSSGSSAQFAKTLSIAKPTKASCFTFGLTHLIGGYMIYDFDIDNGAGFTFAWSTLYLIVNGGASFKSIFSGRIAPAGLSLLALGNAGIYGKKFFWPSKKLLP